MLLQAAQPIIVRVADQPQQLAATSMVDLLLTALGLTGVLLLAAALLGVALGGALIGIKLLRSRYGLERPSDADLLRVTPTSST
ncbi:MAG TPA: hypothetical protein VFX12_12020 [Vicinamibacterales bacterium]|nr:hypothetical protein [Vicinamibacterales bacterium]